MPEAEVDQDILILIQSNGIGSGEPDLGERLMGSFLSTLLESGRVPARMLFLMHEAKKILSV